jgi:hypothetical protein
VTMSDRTPHRSHPRCEGSGKHVAEKRGAVLCLDCAHLVAVRDNHLAEHWWANPRYRQRSDIGTTRDQGYAHSD